MVSGSCLVANDNCHVARDGVKDEVYPWRLTKYTGQALPGLPASGRSDCPFDYGPGPNCISQLVA